jgi:hypothetical protein
MGNSKQELTEQETTNNKTARKTGRKRTKQQSLEDALGSTGAPSDRSSSQERSVEPEPIDGGEKLRSAIDTEVGKRSTQIATALVNKTCAGNMSVARLLAEITGAKNPRTKPPKKRCGPTLAEELAMEPQWQGPEEGDEDISSRPQETPA